MPPSKKSEQYPITLIQIVMARITEATSDIGSGLPVIFGYDKKTGMDSGYVSVILKESSRSEFSNEETGDIIDNEIEVELEFRSQQSGNSKLTGENKTGHPFFVLEQRVINAVVQPLLHNERRLLLDVDTNPFHHYYESSSRAYEGDIFRSTSKFNFSLYVRRVIEHDPVLIEDTRLDVLPWMGGRSS